MREPVILTEAEKLPCTPRGGPIGTEVTVGTAGLPPEEPMLVAFANLQSYELLRRVLTDKDGAFTATVRVPAWADVNVVHYVFVSRLDERPLAMTEPFHVTADDGVARVVGRIGERVNGCLELKNTEGIVYHLVGAPEEQKPGGYVRVLGTLAEGDPCGNGGLAVAVTDILTY
jgi:hypothetical protein